MCDTSTHQAKPLSCLRSYGITANWQDETCSSYFVCDNFVLRVIQCEEGRAFSIMEHACVERSLVDCDEQNNAVRLNVRAAAILRETSDPSYVVPDLDNEDPNNPLSEDARVGAMLHSLRNPGAGRTKRAALKALGVPTSTESIETINITLPESICDRIDAETVIIEALMNAILLTESGCRDLTCGIPLFSLLCREYNDSQDEAPNNSTMAATSANLIQLDTNSTLFTDGGISGSDGRGVNNTLTAGNGTSSANNDSAPSNIFGIFEVPENNGNRISETSGVSRQQGQGNGNSN
ncbi:hypothetical protein Btru_018208 [Bulinus truncatus]|nr:hypothetical protein Btru_018208 [Bulinus truncatus]